MLRHINQNLIYIAVTKLVDILIVAIYLLYLHLD